MEIWACADLKCQKCQTSISELQKYFPNRTNPFWRDSGEGYFNLSLMVLQFTYFKTETATSNNKYLFKEVCIISRNYTIHRDLVEKFSNSNIFELSISWSLVQKQVCQTVEHIFIAHI